MLLPVRFGTTLLPRFPFSFTSSSSSSSSLSSLSSLSSSSLSSSPSDDRLRRLSSGSFFFLFFIFYFFLHLFLLDVSFAVSSVGSDSGPPDPVHNQPVHNVGRVIPEDEERMFRDEFLEFDMNKDGLLDAQEVRKLHSDVESPEIVHFFANVDLDGTGTVTIDEYLAYLMTVV